MRLDADDLITCYYAVAGFVRERHIARRSVPPEVRELLERLDAAVRLSRTRHETSQDATDQEPSGAWMSTTEVAALLGRSQRWVQRHAADIGSTTIGGRLCFRGCDVTEFAERQAAQRVPRG